MMTIQPSDGFEKYICDKASEKRFQLVAQLNYFQFVIWIVKCVI